MPKQNEQDRQDDSSPPIILISPMIPIKLRQHVTPWPERSGHCRRGSGASAWLKHLKNARLYLLRSLPSSLPL